MRSARWRSSLPRLDSEPTLGRAFGSPGRRLELHVDEDDNEAFRECVSAIPLHGDRKYSDLPGRTCRSQVESVTAEIFRPQNDVLQIAAGLHTDGESSPTASRHGRLSAHNRSTSRLRGH